MNKLVRRIGAVCFLFSGAALLGACATQDRLLMPSPVIYQQAQAQEIFQQVTPGRRTAHVDLLYITDRAPDTSPDARFLYGQERARSLAFGETRVVLLPQMTWDELKHQSTINPREQQITLHVQNIEELGRYPGEPYTIRATSSGIERTPAALRQHEQARAALQMQVQKHLQTASSKELMLYVHGFNETFGTAAATAAELCHFFGRVHVCTFFTWPASSTGGPLTSYISTTESALYSVSHLKKAIRTLARTPGVTGVHLLAHSRGTALLLNAIRELAIEAIAAGEEPADVFKFKNWVLMSPDIDPDVASQQLEIFASDPNITTRWQSLELPKFLRGRFTIYASPNDRALRLSEILFRSRFRVGQMTPDEIPAVVQDYFATIGNVDVIVYEGQHTDRFGHSYFTSNPQVSADLIELIRNGSPPGSASRPLERRSKIAWEFPEN